MLSAEDIPSLGYRTQRYLRRHRNQPILAFLLLASWSLYQLYYGGTRPPGGAYAPASLEPIPQQIWQVFFNYSPFERLTESVDSWVSSNLGFTYTLISDEGANQFVERHYHDRPKILHTFLDLKLEVFRADLLRYMLLESEGGYYSDVDTTVRKPIAEWIPSQFRAQTRAIVGIEYDQLDNEAPSHGFEERISLCQWTLVASKGHPMFRAVVEDVVDRLNELALQQGVTVAEVQIDDPHVISITGTTVFTHTVMKFLSAAVGDEVTYKNLTGLKQPRLFGDILIMPVDAFATGQPHSGTSPTEEGALVRHQWKMSWRSDYDN